MKRPSLTKSQVRERSSFSRRTALLLVLLCGSSTCGLSGCAPQRPFLLEEGVAVQKIKISEMRCRYHGQCVDV